MSHKHKTVRLDGDALALAQDIQTVCANAHERREALQREYQLRMEALQEETNRELKTLWPQLHLAAGLPVQEVGEWQLDASYLEHGVAFVSKCLHEEAQGVSLGDLLQSMTSHSRH